MMKLTLQMTKAGFFSNFNRVINHLRYSVEEGNVSAFDLDWQSCFNANSRYYDGENSDLWTRFFSPIVIEGDFKFEKKTASFAELNMTHVNAYFDLYMTGDKWRHDYHKIYLKYIKLKPNIKDEVGAYYQQHMQGKNCIGIHLRNTTVSDENPFPIPTTDRIIEIARQQLSPDNENVVYLATDVDSVIEEFKSEFGEFLLYNDQASRSKNHGPEIHNAESRQPASNLAHDVLLDCLLLSKTNKFIHTTSNIATAVGYINPNVEMIYARYLENDPRALEPVLCKNPNIAIEKHESNEFLIHVPASDCALKVDRLTFLILGLCDGTRTKTDVVDTFRTKKLGLSLMNKHLEAVRNLRLLIDRGVISQGQLKYPRVQGMYEQSP